MIKLFVILVLTEISLAAESTIEPTVQLVSGSLIARQTILFTCPENTRGNLCADDCKTLLTCVQTTNVPAEIRTCAETSPSRPFCIPGARTCSAEGDSIITTCLTASKFLCTDTGYFPDPSNCNQYHVCTDESVETYQCPPQYVYDAANFKCKRRRFSRDCSKINCARLQKTYVAYPALKSYYGYCGLDGETIMFRCDNDNFEFNSKIVDCEFVCNSEGVFPDYKNEQQFYECYRSRLRLVSRIQKCPNKYIFDSVLKYCTKNTAIIVAPLTMTTQATMTEMVSNDGNTTTTTTVTEATPMDGNINGTTEAIFTDGNITTTTYITEMMVTEENKATTIKMTETSSSMSELTPPDESIFVTPPLDSSEANYFYNESPFYIDFSFQSNSDKKTVSTSDLSKNLTLIEWLLH